MLPIQIEINAIMFNTAENEINWMELSVSHSFHLLIEFSSPPTEAKLKEIKTAFDAFN